MKQKGRGVIQCFRDTYISEADDLFRETWPQFVLLKACKKILEAENSTSY
jgi:hypothetical protein